MVNKNLDLLFKETLLRIKKLYPDDPHPPIIPDNPSLIAKNIFEVDFENLRVVIMGQDPYPQPGVATGRAFATNNQKMQPSLKILLEEIALSTGVFSLGIDDGFDTSLQHWVDQGVLLINAALTCQEWQPKSHTKYWEEFMNEYISFLSNLDTKNQNPIVFIFLGKEAQHFAKKVNINKHHVLNYPHPNVETYGGKFIGCGMFTNINKLLRGVDGTEINW